MCVCVCSQCVCVCDLLTKEPHQYQPTTKVHHLAKLRLQIDYIFLNILAHPVSHPSFHPSIYPACKGTQTFSSILSSSVGGMEVQFLSMLTELWNWAGRNQRRLILHQLSPSASPLILIRKALSGLVHLLLHLHLGQVHYQKLLLLPVIHLRPSI